MCGANQLVRIRRDEVEFPIADLLIGGALEPGGAVELDDRPGDAHLHSSIRAAGKDDGSNAFPIVREIPGHS